MVEAVLRIRDVIPDPGSEIFLSGSRILQYIKRGMKNKTNLFLAPHGFKSKTY
jgi:hypothetical protein